MSVTVEQQLLPRLLDGIDDRPMAQLEHHLDVHGPVPDLRRRSAEQLIELVDASGLRGHGGAAFPVAKKLRAVRSGRRVAVVLANGSEGEPASKKDRVLLRELPHLVLDGAAVAARAVGASRAIVAVDAHDERSLHSLTTAVRDRHGARLASDPRFELCEIKPSYLAGQASALVHALNGGPSTPTFAPPRPSERGVGGRATLVQNVETLAHLALIARHGADWFRQLGTSPDPGSALITLSGAIAAPGVYEIEHGMALSELLDRAVPHDTLTAVLIGGYFGTWLTASEALRARLSGEHLSEFGASLGAGVIVALGSRACPVAETSRIADFFAAETAGQCGPCINGLPAISFAVHALATGTADRRTTADLDRWTKELPGRGACQLPDGAARFIRSSLRVFEAEFHDHARHGRCERCAAPATLPTPIPAGHQG